MAIVGPLFAMLGRFAGRVLNSTLGWATILLFGKVEGRKQSVLLLIALGSLAWVLVLVAVALPDAGAFLLTFVPVPSFISESLVRLAMLAAAVALPLLIGAAAVFVMEPRTRPRGFGLVTAVLRGYPFTLVLAVTIVVLAVIALVRKARSLSRRWADAHVPVIVKPGGYDAVVRDLDDVLQQAGLSVQPHEAPRVLALPPRLLDAVAGKALGGLVPDRLIVLQGRGIEVLVYPSDVAIDGTKSAVARARAAIASRLTGSPAYLTATAEAQHVEDEIRVAQGMAVASPHQLRDRLRELDARIARLEVPFEEWETVYRERLQLEAALARAADRSGVTEAPRDGQAEPMLVRILGWAGLVLVALDLLLALADRRRPASRA